jgi:hypothetical protein
MYHAPKEKAQDADADRITPYPEFLIGEYEESRGGKNFVEQKKPFKKPGTDYIK